MYGGISDIGQRLMVTDGERFEGGNYKQFKTSMGRVRIGTDSQGLKWTAGGDPRTGAFHQRQLIVGDIACSVKWVLQS